MKTIKSDGIYFDVLINVKDTGNDQYVYNVQLNENKAALSHALKHLKSKETASNDIVSDTIENTSSEMKFSLKIEEDTDGNKLSEQQKVYFADSKIRDDQGNLKVMYHGTANEFTVFNPFLEGGKNGIQENCIFMSAASKNLYKKFANVYLTVTYQQ